MYLFTNDEIISLKDIRTVSINHSAFDIRLKYEDGYQKDLFFSNSTDRLQCFEGIKNLLIHNNPK